MTHRGAGRVRDTPRERGVPHAPAHESAGEPRESTRRESARYTREPVAISTRHGRAHAGAGESATPYNKTGSARESAPHARA